MHGSDREKEVERLALHITDALSAFTPIDQRCRLQLLRSGFNATFLYLSVKLLYVLNALGQLALLDRFLGGGYLDWSLHSLRAIVEGQEWQESSLFPRVIMCDFTIRRLANPQRHTVQCVMMMNMINEKLFLFLHFWLLLVAGVTLINFLYYLIVLSTPMSRRKFVAMNVNKHEHRARGMRSKDMGRFVERELRADGLGRGSLK